MEQEDQMEEDQPQLHSKFNLRKAKQTLSEALLVKDSVSAETLD